MMKPETKLLRFAIILLLVTVLLFLVITDMLEPRYPKMKCDFQQLGKYKYCLLEEGMVSRHFDEKLVMRGSYYLLDDSLMLKGNYSELVKIVKLYLSQRPEIYNKFMIFNMNYYNEGRSYEDRDRKFDKSHLLGEFLLKKMSAKSDSVKVVEFGYYLGDKVVIDTVGEIIVIETKIDTVK